jgi:hypothetical protein
MPGSHSHKLTPWLSHAITADMKKTREMAAEYGGVTWDMTLCFFFHLMPLHHLIFASSRRSSRAERHAQEHAQPN